MGVNFITFNMLNRLIVQNLYRLPHDIDVIVGVPRSGMIVANIISCYLNKPLTDVAGVIAGKLFDAGSTKVKTDWVRDFSTVKKILVVEDSVASGASINQVKSRLALVNVEKIYLAAIVEPRAINTVDMFFAVVPQPRMFEWNYMHHDFLRRCCVDFDGVLCQDPTPAQNDDGERYRQFILNAAPKLLPSRPIGLIVTARLKKYTEETQFWLRKHHIQCGGLMMLDLESAEERRALGVHANFKAQVYSGIKGAELFIESDWGQAQTIARLSRKDVFCVEAGIIIQRGGVKLKITFLLWRLRDGYSDIPRCRRKQTHGRRHK